jgi:hypothetical protein
VHRLPGPDVIRLARRHRRRELEHIGADDGEHAGSAGNALAIPTGALRQGQEDGKPFVYRIDGKTLQVAPVQLGVVDEQQGIAQVTEGLKAGDRVVVGNVGTLGRGMQVTIAGAEKKRS